MMNDWIELVCVDGDEVSVRKSAVTMITHRGSYLRRHLHPNTPMETHAHIADWDESLHIANPHYDDLMRILDGEPAPEEEPQGRQPRRRQVAEATLREQIAEELLKCGTGPTVEDTSNMQKRALSNIHKLVHADSSDTA